MRFPDRQAGSPKIVYNKTRLARVQSFLHEYQEVFYQRANSDWFPAMLTQVKHELHSYLITNKSDMIFQSTFKMLKLIDYTATYEESTKIAINCPAPLALHSTSPSVAKAPC